MPPENIDFGILSLVRPGQTLQVVGHIIHRIQVAKWWGFFFS